MGKSVFFDAFYFALTGKPYRSTNLSGLINSTNGQKCRVELEFTKNGDTYLIRRGLKFNYFHIYKNGEEIPEDGKRVTYHQRKLEKITGLTPGIIKNTLLINSTLKSFFKLSKQEKRGFIGEIFPNLSVFGKMHKRVKFILDDMKVEFSKNKHIKTVIEKSIEHQKEQVEQYEEIIKKLKNQKKADKNKLESNKSKLIEKNKTFEKHLNDSKEKLIKAKEIVEEIKLKLVGIKSIKEFHDNAKKEYDGLIDLNIKDSCIKCGQSLPENKIKELKKEKKEKLKKLKNMFTVETNDKIVELLGIKITKRFSFFLKIENHADALKIKLNNKDQVYNYIYNIEKSMFSNNQMIKSLQKEIDSFSMELPEKPIINIEKNKNKLKEIEKIIIVQSERLKYLKVSNKILLGDELKAYIISNYIPFINEHFNYYLEKFNLDIKIKFDADFEWTVLTRKYKNYQYDNFSTGERMRLNLSLLFTFIQLAKIINFGSLQLIFNVMGIDEFLDNGMDINGIDDCLSLLNEKNKEEELTIFLISHKFDAGNTDFKVITAEKERGFSKLTEK